MKIWKKLYGVPIIKTDIKYGAKKIGEMFDTKNWEIWPAPPGEEVIYNFFPEFTCLCPRSGYPDFAKVHIVTIPDKKVLELKCLKLWLNSFRNLGISHENATYLIAKTLIYILELKRVFVFMEYTPRGNLTTYPMTELIDPKKDIQIYTDKRYEQLKSLILEKVVK